MQKKKKVEIEFIMIGLSIKERELLFQPIRYFLNLSIIGFQQVTRFVLALRGKLRYVTGSL